MIFHLSLLTNCFHQCDPVSLNMKEILQNNYTALKDIKKIKKHINKASFFIRIKIDPQDKLLDINASNVQSRSVIVYKDELILNDFDWDFGMTPAFRDDEFFLTAKTLAGNRKTASLPMFLGHPHNEKYQPPPSIRPPEVSDIFPTFRPPSFACSQSRN